MLQEEKIFPTIPRSEQSMGPRIRSKMSRNLSEKLGAKFPLTTQDYSMVRIARLEDALLRIFEVEASPIECQLL